MNAETGAGTGRRGGHREADQPVWPFFVALVVAWAAVQLAAPLSLGVELYRGAQLDSDGYTRLLRVQQLLAGEGWFQTRLVHSNWPWGDPNHWTRPLDVLIVGLALPVTPLLGSAGALTLAGSLVSPLLHLAACIAMFWAVAPVASREARVFAMPALLAQPGALAYGTLGRADHHMLLVLLTLVAIGAWIRVLRAPQEVRPTLVAGVACGSALWVSPEGLLPIGLVFGAAGASWLVRGEGIAAAALRFTGALAATVALAIVVERPPAEWFAAEYDRISVAQITMCALAAAFWVGAHLLDRRGAPRRLRTGFVAGAAPLLVLLLHGLHPGYYQGPGAHIHPELDALIMPYIEELQPLFGWGLAALSDVLVQLGGALIAGPLVIVAWKRTREPGRADGFLLILAALCVFVVLAGLQRRFLGYAGIGIALGLVPAIDMLFKSAQRIPEGVKRRLVRIGGLAGLLAGPLLVGGLLGLAPGAQAANLQDEGVACSVPAAAGLLADPSGFGSHARTVAVHINMGPEIAWRTGHRIVSGPYHRSHHGMLDLVETFTTPDEAVWRGHLQSREVEVVLLCPSTDAGFLGTGPEESLYHLLLRGPIPSGFAEQPLPESAGLEGFRLFEWLDARPTP